LKYKTKLILTALVGGILTLFCFLYGWRTQKPIQKLNRPNSGEGNLDESFRVEIARKKYPLNFTLLEIPYQQEEIQKKLQEACKELEVLFLKDNVDMKHIISDVSMPTMFPGTEISIQWYLDSWEYIELDGNVLNEALKQPVNVEAQAILSFQDEQAIWKKTLCVCPLQNPNIEQKIKMLQYQIQESQETGNSSEVSLPDSILGEAVFWYREADNRWIWMLMLTAATLLAMITGQRAENEKLRKMEERSMQMDYPEIVSRLSLYMGAGVSTRKAWERIVDHYEKKKRKEKGSHTAYEEMKKALYEMQSGVSEATAYERFGTRCRMPAYLKLGTLLAQNVKKGTKNLAELLEEESKEAFEERKALAKKLGEECESKLLLPMILLLLTVLIMVMYPAVASFQI